MPAYTLKLLIVGNTEIGKSKFCNAFTNNKSNPEYQPTVGCRIIETDTVINGVSSDNKHTEEFEVTLECWDISGDVQYKNGWGAAKKNCNAIIIMYDSTKMELTDIRMWYDHFVSKLLRSKQCLVLSVGEELPALNQDPKLNKLHCINCEYKENKLLPETYQEILQWIGVSFGYHPDAEFGVFD